MPQIPVICDRCGQAKLSSVVIRDSTYHIAGEDDGPCDCGGTFRFLDGTYTHLGGPINFCRAPEADIARFKQACQACGV